MSKRREKIDIILPNRIGDCITSLPAVLCTKQMFEKYAPESEIILYPPAMMIDIVRALNLSKVARLNWLAKLKSWIKPSDKAFFLCTTSKNIGYKAKTTYGEVVPEKKLIRYSVDMPYLGITKKIPDELETFLHEKHKIPLAQTRYFGICLELGFSIEQIKSVFKFSPDYLSLNEDFCKWLPPFKDINYLVFCMEAAYGKKHEHMRRWQEEKFFYLAEKAYENYNLHSVFTGVEDKPLMPEKPCFIDMRNKLNLQELAQVIKFSKGYIGNDTGPLHLANILKKPSICIYLLTNEKVNGPIFPQFNIPVQNPENPDDIVRTIKKLI